MYVRLPVPVNLLSLTSTAAVAQVGEPPHIAQPHRVPHRGQDEVQPPTPCGSVRLCCRRPLGDHLQIWGPHSIPPLIRRYLWMLLTGLHRSSLISVMWVLSGWSVISLRARLTHIRGQNKNARIREPTASIPFKLEWMNEWMKKKKKKLKYVMISPLRNKLPPGPFRYSTVIHHFFFFSVNAWNRRREPGEARGAQSHNERLHTRAEGRHVWCSLHRLSPLLLLLLRLWQKCRCPFPLTPTRLLSSPRGWGTTPSKIKAPLHTWEQICVSAGQENTPAPRIHQQWLTYTGCIINPCSSPLKGQYVVL